MTAIVGGGVDVVSADRRSRPPATRRDRQRRVVARSVRSSSAARKRTGRSPTPKPTSLANSQRTRSPGLRADVSHHAGHREVAAPAHDLGESPARPLGGTWLSTRISSGPSAVVRSPGRNRRRRPSPRPPALEHEARVEGHQRGRQLGGGIGVGQAAPQRAAMPDGRVAHVTRGLREEGRALDHEAAPP